MADVNIDMELRDASRSIQRRTGETRELNNELTRTQRLARSAMSRSGGGGDTPESAEVRNYNRVRGTVGTGAAGRDFANQAEGLGGVVRLYATFAANIFAVSSAFQNLQQAANFERLIQASKMLGERTGTDLALLGKNLQAATGYALSFEDAMQFANLGTSAGIAAKQMESLVTIAKGAAVGLGRDVNDSVRRIIQGTAKQEQEILDELGIFIKAKKAYDDYAKAFDIKGGADALSAQQRVAAYANAVEQAGSKWKDFATLDDPFSRFTATGKEAINTILNFINQGIKPLLGFLADSKGAVIALALAISGMLAKRALPELKNLAVDLFTFSSARAKAQAEQQRIEIGRQMAMITNTIQTEQAKLAALAGQTQALTMQAVTATLPTGMLARTGAKGQAVGAGIAPKKLEQAIFGKLQSPVDLASYTKAEQLEKKYHDAVKATVGTSQVKLDQMKQLGILQNTSTLNELKLSAAVKTASAEMFAKVQQYNAGLITQQQLQQSLIALEQERAALATRFAATTPGQVRASGSYWQGLPTAPATGPGFVGPTRPQTAQQGGLAPSMARAGSGFVAGTALVGDIAARMNDVVGGSTKVKFQQFTTNLLDMAKGFTVVQGSAAKAGVAVGILGTIVSGAFRGIMAAFGPLMILWTLWELFGSKLMPNSWKAAKELQTKFEELEGTLATTGSSLARLNEAFGKGVESSKEYGNYLNMFSNALQSQIDAYKKIIDAKKEAENVDLLKKASKEYALRGEQFNNDIYAIDQLIDAANRLGLSQGDEIERLKKLKKEYQDLEKFKGAINYGKSGMFMMGFRTEPEKEAERRAAELARGQVQVREDLNKPLQQRISISSQISKAADDSEKIIDDFNKKVSGVPLLGEKAATETSRAMAQVFNTFNTALKDGVAQQDETGMQKTAEGLIKTFEGLAPNSAAAAQGLAAVAAAAEAAALSGQKLSSTDIIKILQTFQPRVIDNINEKTQKYSTSTLKYFSELEASLNSLILSIARVDLEISKTSSFNDRIEALRGYASEQEIAFSKTQQYNKAELEFSKELRQAQLDLQKVLSQGVGTGAEKAKPEEVQAAKARYALAVGQAAIARDQKNLNADITAENKTLDSVLKQISEKYEAINSKIQLQNARTEASLKLEQERLRILKEAGALSEPRIVEMETQTQGRQIQQNFEQSNLAATTAANEAAEQARERYFAALERAGNDQAKIANAIDAYGTALVKVNAKEKDAQTLAAIRRDNEMEILRISSEARKVYAELAETEKTRAQQQALDATKLDTQRQLVDLQKEELQYKLDLGLITQDVYDKEVNGINKTIRAQEYKNKLLEIEARYKRETDKIEADIKVTGIAGGLDETGTGILTLEQAESFNKRKEAAKSQRDAEIKGAQDVFSANERLKGMYESMSTEQKGLASIYKDTFAAMGDSIVEFVRTGKMNFKSLITDMLASIAKLYLNRMFMSLFSNMLPGLPGMGTTPGLTSVMGVPNALGNVYSDKGLQKYAKGGMFTNSIVDSPTLFKFAKGTGLMGEAGPEAIIPLKRDSQGNLGVRGGGGGASVEVVVNNYSGEKAEARETTDSRGNRKVEVIVGDMVGGEVSRSSSSTHRSIRGTFGLQPQLIRR